MIDKAHDLPVVGRVSSYLSFRVLLSITSQQPTSEMDLMLMRRIDELRLEHPFAGARDVARMLKLEGHEIGRKHVGTLMKKLDIQAVYRKADTSRRDPAHRIYPYLLRGLAISVPNQCWAMDNDLRPDAPGLRLSERGA